MPSFALVSSDLMSGSALGVAARQAGVSLVTVASWRNIATQLPADVVRVFVDLTMPGLNIAEAVQAIRTAAPAAQIVAFGPHVQMPQLDLAQAAGCDAVLTRGQFHAGLDALLKPDAG